MSRYSIKVDWLSLVLPNHPTGEGSDEDAAFRDVYSAVRSEINGDMASRLFSGVQPLGYGRAPYTWGWQDLSTGVTVWFGGKVPHLTIEISGRGMDYIREIGAENVLIALGAERCSRIDLAIDLEQGVEPEEFLKFRKDTRQKTFANMNSTGGSTCYVGSRHSERYLRVYRYSSPHPRSHLLRAEIVLRRAYSRVACASIAQAGLEATAKGQAEYFGFDHLIDWDASVEAQELTLYRPERNQGKTMRWLITQVAPAFQRLVKDGTIPDAEQFLLSYFLNGLEEQHVDRE